MAGVQVSRSIQGRALISLVPMIDVMLILLVFFMVTSTYLDLDMVPAVQRDTEMSDPGAGGQQAAASALLVRIAADGRPSVAGSVVDLDTLGLVVTERLANAPATAVVLLPSGRADMQALVTVMDRVTQAGATQLRVIRLDDGSDVAR